MKNHEGGMRIIRRPTRWFNYASSRLTGNCKAERSLLFTPVRDSL
jgi:hypothetical protein